MDTMVKLFQEVTPELFAAAGGKGGMLSRMYREGYPVPPGIIVFPDAFRDDGQLKKEAWVDVKARLNVIRKRHAQATFVVRSSALSEDSAEASFAGEFETVLNQQTDQAIHTAIEYVAASAHTKRVKAYTQAKGLAGSHQMAVVIQLMVNPELSGVLFTVDPVSGSQRNMLGNYVYGLGEQLVSGEVDAETFSFARPSGKYTGPSEFKPYAKEMYRLALRLESTLNLPQDIEWGVADGVLYILQTRPVTTLSPGRKERYEINDSLRGDELWVNANVGEAVPEVVMPYTWSLIRWLDEMMTFAEGYYIWSGNICGRIYSNYGRRISAVRALGLPEKLTKKLAGSDLFGDIPKEVELPIYPYSKTQIFQKIVPQVLSYAKKIRQAKKTFDEDIENNPEICLQMEKMIQQAETTEELLKIWDREIVPYVIRMWYVQGVGGSQMRTTVSVKDKLSKFMTTEDVNLLLSNVHSGGTLASMGPLTGIDKVFKGEMSRSEYLNEYGHRSPYELELSIPSPSETPQWLEKQVKEYARANVDVDQLLEEQQQQFQQTLTRFLSKYPRKEKWLINQLDQTARASRIRETARSEFTRTFRLNRVFGLKAAELTKLGEDVFFLYLDEVLALLNGDNRALKWLPFRKEKVTYYKSLPPFPPVIRGRFDPFLWAEDDDRPTDYYTASGPLRETDLAESLTGTAGSSGTAEGVVRIVKSLEESTAFRTGEILVTHTTNIGWTPLFPRAAAIITDVGAPLSHAAIVARELGIPAVVGCGNATTRLKTGDTVRVNGGQGTVHIIK